MQRRAQSSPEWQSIQGHVLHDMEFIPEPLTAPINTRRGRRSRFSATERVLGEKTEGSPTIPALQPQRSLSPERGRRLNIRYLHIN